MTSETPGARKTCTWRFHFGCEVFAVIACALAAMPAFADDDFDAYRKRALEARETPGVPDYTWNFFKLQGDKLRELLSTCGQQASDAPRGTLQIVVSVTTEGALSEVLVQPDTEFSRCVVTGFTSFEFLRPPAVFADGKLPVLIEIKLK
jgi:hypothetical protein